MRRLLGGVFAALVTLAARLLTGATARWLGCAPSPVQRIYFANHSSHADFVLIWAALPGALRLATRPVAGGDYWEKDALRRFVIHDALRGVVIDRARTPGSPDPIDVMVGALAEGASLIVFPEGTRNTTDAALLPFKSGLFHVASRRPDVELVPVWMENLGRVLPKGKAIPVPLLCSVSFGAPIRLGPEESRAEFLDRARGALLGLAASVRPR